MSDFIKNLEKSGAVFFPRASLKSIELANITFQQIKASILPKSLFDFYLGNNGAILGDSNIFPVDDVSRVLGREYVIPGILKVNRDLSHISQLRGKTVWGRNQIYLFSADIGGVLYMHDILTLQVLRKYNDFGNALTDCLLVGKI